jgi:hypothetical protein
MMCLDDNELPVRGDVMKALDDLEAGGQIFTELLTKSIESDGIILDGHHHYSLRDIEESLHVFGSLATSTIIKVLKNNIRSQYHLQVASI